MAIKYVKGDATQPIGDSGPEGSKIIAHICNDMGGWGRGFVLAISKRWADPEEQYRHWHTVMLEGGDLPLGQVQVVWVEPGIRVCNMIAQHDVVTVRGVPPIRYEALDECLQALAQQARWFKASIHMPRIGCGLAGGTWDRVAPLIERRLSGLDVTVYDLP